MPSCLYAGTVHHDRHEPFKHRFRYRLFLCYLDLDELDSIFAGCWLWSAQRPAVARFRRTDHFGDPNESLSHSVKNLVREELGFRPSGPVRLLTQLRYFGHIMNPVCFHYCFADNGEHLQAVVAEVTNTPWGETHCYVIDARNDASPGEAPAEPWRMPGPGHTEAPVVTASHRKSFHVSPFMPMEMRYDWKISQPGDALRILITSYCDQTRIFDAALTLRRQSITTTSLACALLRFPLMTVRIAAAIHWQALRLWLKGAEFHPHPHKHPRRTVRATTRPAERDAVRVPIARASTDISQPPCVDLESSCQTEALARFGG